MPRTLALTVAFDGTDWAGFQRQATRPSVQGALEAALSTALQHPATIVAAGRTDAGVHALGQVISLHTPNPMPVERLPGVVNRLLPDTIRVRRARVAPDGFHARFAATARRYWYLLQEVWRPDPLRGRFCWQVTRPLDTAAMRAALAPLVGVHDFAAFAHAGGPPSGSTVRHLVAATVQRRGSLVIVDVRADAFLHQMVRLLVANSVLIGWGERPVEWLVDLRDSRNRHRSGMAAPPQGLTLMRVGYAPEIFPRMGEGGEFTDEEFPGEAARS